MRKLILCLALLGFITLARGQTINPKVTSSAGNYSTGGSVTLMWVLGETYITTGSGGSNILTQGFNQPGDPTVISLPGQFYQAAVFPTLGAYSTAGGVSLSTTVGETYHATLQGGSNYITQGFQQPDISLVFTPPIAVCQNLIVAADANCEGNALASAFDNGSSDPDGSNLTFSASPAGPYSLGITNVIVTVTDGQGQTAQCNATITVEDQTGPVVAGVGADFTIECDVVPVFSSPGVSDNCDNNPSFVFNDVTIPGACSNEYSITRTWTATDASGNISTASQTISFEDNTAPVISGIGPNATIECPATPVFDSPTMVDNCDLNPVLTFVDVSTPGLCTAEYSVTRIWTAIDACGNAATASQTIFIEDNTAPSIVCPPDVIVCENDPIILGNATASDLCGSVTVTFAAPGTYVLGVNIVTWTATDECGNSATCTQTVTVNELPVLTAAAASPVVCEGGSTTVTISATGGGGIYNGTGVFNVGAGPYSFTVTDNNGCSATISGTIDENIMNALIVPTLYNGQQLSCTGTSDGEVIVIGLSIINGVPTAGPLSYSVNGGIPQLSNVFSGLGAGNYTFTVTDPGTGCSFTTPVYTIANPDPVVVNTTTVNAGCLGTGSATATASGGTGTFIYEWFNVQNVKVDDGPNAGSLGPGTYTVVVTDANGCTVSATVTIGSSASITVDLGFDKTVFYGALGYNGCHTLTPVVTGATAPLSYSWSSTNPAPAIATYSGNALFVCVTTDVLYSYTVIVTDANGCTGSATVNIVYANIDCSNQQNAGKVTICNVPPGNPSNCTTICVSVSAAAAILANGGYVGPCLPNCAQPGAKVNTPVIDTNAHLELYPNPASETVYIEYNSENDNAEFIVITDLQGREIEKMELYGAFEFKGNLDLTRFENGIYFVNVLSRDSVIKSAKLVKSE